MILILIGSIISSLGGFKAQEIIPKTETFHIQNILSAGQLTKIPKISTRINDFWITYNKQTAINQFYSDISFLDNTGNEIKRETIYVNSPANFHGIKYYQTDWNLIGLRVKDNNLVVLQYPFISLLNQREKIWISWISMNQDFSDGFTILINNLQGYCSVYNKFGLFLGNLELNETLEADFPFSILDIISSTGLQVKQDPGIPLIYTGFGFLMFSTLISYFTYSQFWVVQDQKRVFIGGNTTRAILDFELEFFELSK